jgi:hypothetical protein
VAAALLLSLIADYDHGIRTLRRPMTFRLSAGARQTCGNTASERPPTATSEWCRCGSPRNTPTGSSHPAARVGARQGARSGTGPEVISVDVTRSYVPSPSAEIARWGHGWCLLVIGGQVNPGRRALPATNPTAGGGAGAAPP